jgi:UDP-N-acetylglucosamine 3-dehydrogenase
MRIGILGTGFGKRHGEIFASFPDVEVVGIVGRNEQKTREVAHTLGVSGYTDPNELIDSPDVDAIDVCYPTNVHSKYVIAALIQGKHVFCETPIAYTITEAEQMSETAASCGRLLLVALFGRVVSDYKYVHDYIEAGHLGKPRVVFANRRTPPIWGNGWDQNFILDLMLHDVDYLYWLLGKPLTVTSRALENPGKGWEHVFIALEYEDTSAIIEGCGIMPPSFPFSTSLRVVCEDGAIDLNWYWGGKFPISEVKLYPQKGEPEILSVPDYDPYEAECRYFVDCIRGEADPSLLSIDAACSSLNIALAARMSLEQNGKRIEI